MSSSVQNNTKPPLRDRIIPWYFVMAFAVVFIVNGIFVYLATTRHSGVVTENPYEKGLKYNETISLAKTQAELGWQTTLSYVNGELTYTIQDQSGNAIRNADVEAVIERPLNSEYTRKIMLKETSNGVYSATVDLPLKGQWDITTGATWNKHYHQSKQRLVVN